mgnify:CR=1 FL=1
MKRSGWNPTLQFVGPIGSEDSWRDGFHAVSLEAWAMPFEITEQNAAALAPLFKPWEEPLQHRLPNPARGGPAVIQAGRRPSKCPLVRAIRAEVDGWRRGGYAGVSETSRTLLDYWFNTEHTVENEDGIAVPFRYHWAQREAIETIIYLHELRRIRGVAELLSEFGQGALDDIIRGIPPETDRWPRSCCRAQALIAPPARPATRTNASANTQRIARGRGTPLRWNKSTSGSRM